MKNMCIVYSSEMTDLNFIFKNTSALKIFYKYNN